MNTDPTHALVYKEYGGGQRVEQMSDIDERDLHITIITTGTRAECLAAMRDDDLDELMKNQENQPPTKQQKKYYNR